MWCSGNLWEVSWCHAACALLVHIVAHLRTTTRRYHSTLQKGFHITYTSTLLWGVTNQNNRNFWPHMQTCIPTKPHTHTHTHTHTHSSFWPPFYPKCTIPDVLWLAGLIQRFYQSMLIFFRPTQETEMNNTCNSGEWTTQNRTKIAAFSLQPLPGHARSSRCPPAQPWLDAHTPWSQFHQH